MLLSRFIRSIQDLGLMRADDLGGVAFSGGGDSLCMLHMLCSARGELGITLRVLVVDHGIQQGSSARAGQALELARELGQPATLLRARLGPHPPGNLQEAARRARLGLLQDAARNRHLAWVALGHTATDQAETVIMHAVRGSGIRGIGGMSPGGAGVFIRPMLDITRDETGTYNVQHGLVPVADPSNDTDMFFRNRVRREVLPLLERENPAVVKALCRLAANCRQEEQALESLSADAHGEAARGDGCLDVEALQRLSPAILNRVLMRGHEEATGLVRALERKHLLALGRLVQSTAGTRRVDLPGIRAERQYDRLSFRDGSAAPDITPRVIQEEGTVDLGQGRTLSISRKMSGTGERDAALDPNKVRFPLLVRSAGKGDRISVGVGKSRKVSRELMDAKIPRLERRSVPIIVQEHTVISIVGVRVAFGFSPPPDGSRLVLSLMGGMTAPGRVSRPVIDRT